MNSKDALNNLFIEANRLQDQPYRFNTAELIEMVNVIDKDLEVLDILKKKLGIFKGHGYFWLEGWILTDEEHEKISRWLNEHK